MNGGFKCHHKELEYGQLITVKVQGMHCACNQILPDQVVDATYLGHAEGTAIPQARYTIVYDPIVCPYCGKKISEILEPCQNDMEEFFEILGGVERFIAGEGE